METSEKKTIVYLAEKLRCEEAKKKTYETLYEGTQKELEELRDLYRTTKKELAGLMELGHSEESHTTEGGN